MDLEPTQVTAALTALLLLAWMWRRQRGRALSDARRAREALDTVADWTPELAPVLSHAQLKAYELLADALAPEFLLLAQVPVARVVRVPRRCSYAEWMRRVGFLNVDLLVCGADSAVLLAISIRSTGESDRRRRRHERLARVMRAAGVQWQAWHADELPAAGELRALRDALRARVAGHASVKPESVPRRPASADIPLALERGFHATRPSTA